jgi:chromosome partition protein MukE
VTSSPLSSAFASLEEVILDPSFPDVDLALRRGRHVGRDDGPWYELLVDGLDHLEPFYQRYGCELVHRSDGYFYLLPSGDRLGQRHLSAGEMLVGQALALLYLDPSSLEHGGVVRRELVLGRLAGLVGADALVRTLDPRKKRYDERVAAETVRTRVGTALRHLEALGFVALVDEERVALRPSLLRFAEPVRGLEDPARALEQLVQRGEVVRAEPSAASAAGDDSDERADERAESEEDDA